MPTFAINYAPSRITGTPFTVAFPAAVNGPRLNSDSADTIRNNLVAGGWTQTGDKKATAGLILILIDAGATVTWLGQFYQWYDPAHPPTFLPGIIYVPLGSNDAGSLANMASFLTSPDWSWSFTLTPEAALLVTAHNVMGTDGNGFSAHGPAGANTTTNGGGWVVTSQAANGITQVTITVFSDGDFFSDLFVAVDLNGNIAETNAFGSGTYSMVVNPYQYVMFLAGNTDGPMMVVCAPYVLPAYQSMLGYTAFAKTGITAALGLAGTAVIDGSIAAVYTNGAFSTSAEADVLLHAYASNFALITSDNKTVVDQCLLALPMSPGGESRIVGSIWDTFTESTLWGLGAQTNTDGHNFIAMYSQIGGDGGFWHGTGGTVWLADS